MINVSSLIVGHRQVIWHDWSLRSEHRFHWRGLSEILHGDCRRCQPCACLKLVRSSRRGSTGNGILRKRIRPDPGGKMPILPWRGNAGRETAAGFSQGLENRRQSRPCGSARQPEREPAHHDDWLPGPDLKMPPDKPLAPNEVAALQEWIRRARSILVPTVRSPTVLPTRIGSKPSANGWTGGVSSPSETRDRLT